MSVTKRDGICFVIMPFGGWFDSYYKTIYIPAIKAAGLEPHRADDLYRPSSIINDIWSYTKRSKLILADLTGRNPNVLYELGLAHAISKPAVIVCESIDEIPFDLRALRIIEYNKNAPDWGEALKVAITTAIEEIIVSPLHAVLPTFLDIKDIEKAEVTQHDKEIIQIRQEIDLLKLEMRKDSVSFRRGAIDHYLPLFLRDAAFRERPLHEVISERIEEGAGDTEIINEIISRSSMPWNDAYQLLKDSKKD